MRVDSKKRYGIIFIVTFLVIVEICMVFLMYKSSSNKQTLLDDVNLSEQESSMFAIMLEQNKGQKDYEESATWPDKNQYKYNSDNSGCINKDGDKIDNALSYSEDNNIATVNTNDTSYCYLYFDKIN